MNIKQFLCKTIFLCNNVKHCRDHKISAAPLVVKLFSDEILRLINFHAAPSLIPSEHLRVVVRIGGRCAFPLTGGLLL